MYILLVASILITYIKGSLIGLSSVQ